MGCRLGADDQGELAHLPPQLGDDSFGRRLADARERGEHLDVLILDHPGELADGTDHRPKRLANAHAVDRAEDVEELAVDRREETDHPGHQSSRPWSLPRYRRRCAARSARRAWTGWPAGCAPGSGSRSRTARHVTSPTPRRSPRRCLALSSAPFRPSFPEQPLETVIPLFRYCAPFAARFQVGFRPGSIRAVGFDRPTGGRRLAGSKAGASEPDGSPQTGSWRFRDTCQRPLSIRRRSRSDPGWAASASRRGPWSVRPSSASRRDVSGDEPLGSDDRVPLADESAPERPPGLVGENLGKRTT